MKKSTYIKYIATAALAALLAASLMSCGSDDLNEETQQTVQVHNASYTLTVNGQELQPGIEMPENLGEPTSYFEAASCAIEGFDKSYTYGSILVTTEDDGKTERITGMTILDDGAATRNGVTIGDSKDKVLSVYGATGNSTETSLSYTYGSVTVKFLLRDGSVTSITYSIAE